MVAHRQGAHPRHRPLRNRHLLGVGTGEDEEGRARRSDGDRLRSGRHPGGPERADARRVARLDAAGVHAFDTGRIGDEADGAPQAETTPADTVEAEPAAEPEATEAADESGDAPADAPPAGNGHAEPAAPASGPSDEDAGDAGNAATEATGAGPATGGERDGIAAHAGPVNGHDPARGPARDPMDIPEFLRRVH